MAISRIFTPFFTKYQTDEPVLPFISQDLTVLIKSRLKRFIKSEVLRSITPLQLVKLDSTDKMARVPLKNVDIGLGAETVLKELQSRHHSTVSEHREIELKQDCMDCITKIVQKLQMKSPLMYGIVRQMTYLDPKNMFSDPDLSKERMKRLVEKFLQEGQLSGGVSAGDVIIQQFKACLSLEAKLESFSSFQPMQTRLDVFLHCHLCKSYPELWTFCKKLLLLSHGQATMECSFSVNKEVEEDNMQEDAIVAQRIICDYVSVGGGVLNGPLTKELLGAAASARSQYRLYLEGERRKQESQAQKQKRKAAEDHVEELRKKCGPERSGCQP